MVFLFQGGVPEDSKLFASVQKVSLKMGYLYQVQDDYLDCYGDQKLTGKIGTDIVERKCTWLLVNALSQGSENQKEVIKVIQGSTQSKSISKI